MSSKEYQKSYREKNRDKIRSKQNEYNKNNKEKAKQQRIKANLKKNYGITVSLYLEKQKLQNNVCAICKRTCSTGRRLSVDHCHKTGKIRGLLCSKCNRGLGSFNDDLEIIRNIEKYLLSYARL